MQLTIKDGFMVLMSPRNRPDVDITVVADSAAIWTSILAFHHVRYRRGSLEDERYSSTSESIITNEKITGPSSTPWDAF